MHSPYKACACVPHSSIVVRIDVALPHPIKRTLWNICHVAPQSRGLLIVAFWTDSYKRNREKCNNHNNNIHIYMYIHILLYLLFFSFFCSCCLFSLSSYRNRLRMQQLIVLQIRKVHVPRSRKVHVPRGPNARTTSARNCCILDRFL